MRDKKVIRSGHEMKPVERYEKWEKVVTTVSKIEQNYYSALLELKATVVDNKMSTNILETEMIKAALGGGFSDTTELKPLKYHEAMATEDASKRNKAVKKEYDRRLENRVF